MKRDPLTTAEQLAVTEELIGGWRHDGRNRLATIRNAAFYLKRRVNKTELWTSDPRVSQFFTLIEESLVRTDELLGRRPGLDSAAGEPPRVSLGDAVDLAVTWARGVEGTRFEVDVAATTIAAPLHELAVAIRCLLENAAQALNGAGVVHVRGSVQGEGYVFEVGNEGPPATVDPERMLEPRYTTKPGHLGLGLNVARRIALRCQAALEVETTPAGTRVRLLFQPAEAGVGSDSIAP